MKLLFCVLFLSTFLIFCKGKIKPSTRSSSTTTTTSYTTTTTTYPYTTTAGRVVNLRGKMVTLSPYSTVTFCRQNYCKFSATRTPTTTTTTKTTEAPATTWFTSTTAPVTRGVSVCLRFLTDNSNSFDIFKLAPRSYQMSFSFNDPWYTLNREYTSAVSLKPMIPLWSSVRPQPWTSVCVVVDNLQNVVQVFQGEFMSIVKLLPSKINWSEEPVVEVSGFEGQVTDLEVWDYPLKNEEIFSFMQNYGSSGTVLTWSNVEFVSNGNILVQDTYALGQSRPVSSSKGEEQPIRSGRGRDRRLRHRMKFNGWSQGRREMI